MAAPVLAAETTAFVAARAAIARVREAGTGYAHAVGQECALVRQKAGRKAEAIKRLMADPAGNGLTGKPHSASSRRRWSRPTLAITNSCSSAARPR